MAEEQQQNQQVEEPRREETQGTETADNSPKTISMTQEELDELIAKRVGRVNKKLEKLKEQYADYDDVKSKLSEFESKAEEQRQAELSEVERLKEELEVATREKEELSNKLNEVSESMKNSKIDARFQELAKEHNIEYLAAAKKLADLSEVTVDDEGVHGMEDIVKNLVKENPFLVARAEPETVGEASNPPKKTDAKTKAQMLEEAKQRARSGNPRDMAAYLKLKRQLNTK
ncbi:phage scaffolding protein [Paludifilum halophilum]|uniref:Scaffolding protein n=1 Tax=Paludifilum halophilum TaxID=1642702 RepID=A0A235B971_9BACL|nr:hypothetical protein [Paludifilum halophilum]OYD08539.1 hypothetical protein CHM34_06850 [Paludifilum halophilum]